MADGLQGAGYIDSNGNWVDVPGTTLSSAPQDLTSTPEGGQLITTPSSSRGTPLTRAPGTPELSPEFAPNPHLTPRSTSGAPSSGVNTFPISRGGSIPITDTTGAMPGGLPVASPLFTGVGALNAFPTPTPEQMTRTLNNPPMANDPWGINAISKLFGGGQPQTQPITQTGPQPQGVTVGGRAVPPPPPTPTPPGGLPPPPPPGNLPPFVRGPIPGALPQSARAPTARAPSSVNLGYGAPAAGVPPAAPSPMFTTIDRPNADIAGGRSVAGQLAPQYFTKAYEPGGPAQMGALDLSGLFNHPAAAAHPAVQGALSALAAPNMNDAMLGMQMQNAGGGRARAPVMQQQSPYVYPRQNAPAPSKDINAIPLRKSYNPFQLFGTPT